MLEIVGAAVIIAGAARVLQQDVRVFAACMIVVLPVLKDGPLDIDLGKWKLALVVSLVVFAAMQRPGMMRYHRQAKPVYLVMCAVLAAGASYGFAQRRDLSFDMTQSFVTSALFVLLCVSVFDRHFVRMAIRGIIVLSIGVCTVALVQYVTIAFRLDHAMLLRIITPEARAYFFELGNTLGEEGVRLPSVFFHANQLGHVLGLCFGILFPLLLATSVPRHRLVYAGTLAMICGGTFLTLSRGAFVIIVVEAVVVLAFVGGRSVWQRRSLIAFVGVFVVMTVALRDNIGPLLSRITTGGLSFRATLWEYGARLLPEYYALGVGPGGSSFQILTRFPVVDHTALVNSYYIGHGYDVWSSAPHNYYLTTLLEGGVFSLVFRLALYVAAVRLGVGLLHRLRHRVPRAIALAVTVPLGTEFLRSGFDSYDFLSATESGSIVALCLATVFCLDSRWATRHVRAERES